MSKEEVKVNYGCGGGALTILGVVLVILKALEIITWSWWLVLLPFYIGFLILFGGFILALLIISIGALLVWIFE